MPATACTPSLMCHEAVLLQLPIAEEHDRGGTRPDVLLPAMLAAGVVTEGGPTAQERHAPTFLVSCQAGAGSINPIRPEAGGPCGGRRPW
ncbi:hypothetical protein GCM10009802_33080 [Streptomyces synnematoformans]|uniref:Uncharacterized protein n=1 Tax=Streptomyces synnematoformans TaxID=415721 RepID=A0ABN2YJ17_9ACTN